MKKIYFSLYLSFFISCFCVAQEQNTANAEPIKIQDAKQPFIYRIESDNPEIKLLIALSNEDIRKIEENIMQYEKQKNIADRTSKVYILNPNFQVKSVAETEK